MAQKFHSNSPRRVLINSVSKGPYQTKEPSTSKIFRTLNVDNAQTNLNSAKNYYRDDTGAPNSTTRRLPRLPSKTPNFLNETSPTPLLTADRTNFRDTVKQMNNSAMHDDQLASVNSRDGLMPFQSSRAASLFADQKVKNLLI